MPEHPSKTRKPGPARAAAAPDGAHASHQASHPTQRRQWLQQSLAAVPLLASSGMPTAQTTATAPPSVPPSVPVGPRPSPVLTPFVTPMPVIPALPSRPLTDPAFARAPKATPDRAINPLTRLPYEGRGDVHQSRDKYPPQIFFAQRFGAVPPVSIHPSLPLQVNFWGANLGGANLAADRPMTPMPTIVSRYQKGANTAILVRRFNNLPSGTPTGGFGKNQVSTHFHNFHSAPDSDGGPCDPALGALSEDPVRQGRFFFPGQFYDYYYNMKRAGFADKYLHDGDVRQTLGTMWYHDHREAHTAENVYKGLYGFHLVFNEYDTGVETTGFRLPSYPAYDIPIAFVDVAVNPNTLQASFDVTEPDGHLGDLYLVNGKIQPYLDVRKRRYRFRLLNVGPGRHYELYITNPDNPAQTIPVWRIANDGNLYENPLLVTKMKLAPAERADIVVDFAKLTARGGPAAGARRLWLENRLVQTNLRKPEDRLDPPGTAKNALLEWRIGAPAPDASVELTAKTSFAPILLPPLPAMDQVLTRTFKWERMNGVWACNGKLIDCNEIRFTMKRGRPERWIHRTSGGWAHPIHNHFVEGRITKRNGVAIGPGSQEYVRKDVVALYPGDEVEFMLTAVDYLGVYPMHCHNALHEDYGMMLMFRVDDVGDNKAEP